MKIWYLGVLFLLIPPDWKCTAFACFKMFACFFLYDDTVSVLYTIVLCLPYYIIILCLPLFD